ncbi:MAG: hypothetical protein C0497_08350 [Gemmatimonas sp.]|nr:hypothetical protein [Gemmatimonas sp.]
MRPDVMAGPTLRARRPPKASVVKGERGVVSAGTDFAAGAAAVPFGAGLAAGAAAAGFASAGFAAGLAAGAPWARTPTGTVRSSARRSVER